MMKESQARSRDRDLRLLAAGSPSSAFALSNSASRQAHTPSNTVDPLRAMFHVDSVVAIYETHEAAEQAVRQLQAAGVDMTTLSIAAKDTHVEQRVTGYYNAGDRMLYWGKRGAFWGAMWGLLFDSALFAIPGVGPVLLAGPLVSWIVAVLEGALVFGGVSALGASLISIGIPRDSVLQYENALKTDNFLLIVHGTAKAVAVAQQIIHGTRHSYTPSTAKMSSLTKAVASS